MRGIITGASRGLGLALTSALSERGWPAPLTRGAEALEHAIAGLAGVVAIAGDVADSDHRRRLVATAGEPIDLLVNNASLLGPSRYRLGAIPLEELRSVYEANVFAPLALVQLSLPRLSPHARIINLISDAASRRTRRGVVRLVEGALAQITAVLGAERSVSTPTRATCAQMQQDAFPE